MKKFLFILLSCTWGALTTLVGLIAFLILRKKYPHKTYRGCIDTQWNTRSGLSLGLFIFTPREDIPDSQNIRVHEYGHCIQSIVLGPLFLIPGLMSLAWGRRYGKLRKENPQLRYTSHFVESWASKWGEMITHEDAIWD